MIHRFLSPQPSQIRRRPGGRFWHSWQSCLDTFWRRLLRPLAPANLIRLRGNWTAFWPSTRTERSPSSPATSISAPASTPCIGRLLQRSWIFPVERFTVIQGDTGITPNHGGTGGSSGVPRAGADIRQAAATARMALLERASAQLNCESSLLTISEGEVETGRRR